MLLRRLTQHVKDQNWFAVTLDFLIVVLGILIAFQITNWNEAALDRAKERQIIERLYIDFTALKGNTNEKIEFLESIAHLHKPMEQLLISGPKDADLKQLQNFFEFAFHLPQTAGQSDTYEQLVASGDMNIIANNQLRAELAAHASMTRELIITGQAVREWSRPYIVPLVRLQSLIEAIPLNQAISEAGSKADLIVAIDMYRSIFEQQLPMLISHRESFTKITEMLAQERR